MNAAILLFFFCSINATATATATTTNYQIHKKTNGFDHRPKIPESPIQLYRITKYFEKKQLLDTLEDPQIPLHVKVNLIPNTGITPPNLYAGGIMRDFLFDMEEPLPLQN
jgi:hypothetical protein